MNTDKNHAKPRLSMARLRSQDSKPKQKLDRNPALGIRVHLCPSVVRFCAASLMVCAGATLNANAAEASDNFAEPSARPPSALDRGRGARFDGYRRVRLMAVLRSSGRADRRGLFPMVGEQPWHCGLQVQCFGATPVRAAHPRHYPWQKHSFHVSVGMMFNQNQITGNSSGFGPVTIAGQTTRPPTLGCST